MLTTGFSIPQLVVIAAAGVALIFAALFLYLFL